MKLFLKNRCYNGGNKHKFEPRYDEKPSDIVAKKVPVVMMRELAIINIYIHDICIWCGEKIDKW